ncbi:MAG: sulfatase-like hydrolase/transferase [Pseudomonadota bacterium]
MTICASPFLVLLGLAACHTPDEGPPAAPVAPSAPAGTRRPSLVLVTLDTTRADHLGCYGHPTASTPTLDAIAAQGWRFERAYTAVPLTTPSHATILSGLYPTRHGIHTNGDAVLPESVETLAERLAAQGYRTAASVAAFTTTRIWNFDQGFEQYYDEVEGHDPAAGRWARERPADAVVDDALTWLGTVQGEPFFLWVHFFDPHDPYTPPEPWAGRYPDAPYDGEIAYMDQELGRLRQAVAARQEPVAWILSGDHGEALSGEHGEYKHGMFLYDETTRVPLLVQPAEPPHEGVVIPTGVGTVDILPTALGLLGLPAPEGLDGQDLGPLVRGNVSAHPSLYMEAFTALKRFGYHPEVAATDGRFKLMDTPHALLFDLLADPGEHQDVSAAHAEQRGALHGRVEEVRSQRVLGEAMAPAPEVAEQLQALGYMDGGFTYDPEALPTVDAKDRLDTLLEMERLRRLAVEPGKAEEAAAAYRAVLAREPTLQEAYLGLARACGRAGRPKEALEALQTALAREPDSTVLKANLATSLAAQGRKEEGIAVMQSILDAVPGDDIAQAGMLRMLTDLNREQEAVSLAQAWLQENPGDPTLEALEGVALTRLGRYAEAEPLLEGSLEDSVPRQFVQRCLATIAEDRDDLRPAVRHLRKEIDAFGGNVKDHAALADLYSRIGNWDEAATEFAYLSEIEPQNTGWRRNQAQAIFNSGDFDLAAQILAPLLPESPPAARGAPAAGQHPGQAGAPG